MDFTYDNPDAAQARYRELYEVPGNEMSARDREEFSQLHAEFGDTRERHEASKTHMISQEASREAHAKRSLIGTDTHDLPEWRPDNKRVATLEARHSLSAYLSQRPDWNPSGLDIGSFDRDKFYHQLMTRNYAGAEYRALAEGSQSVTATGAGITVPIAFSSNVLELLRANLVFTAPGADGSINGPQVVDMHTRLMEIPVWSTDGANVAAYIAENAQLTPGTPSFGVVQAQAETVSSVCLASRQSVEDSVAAGGLGNLVESNMALAIARGMDTSALYGTGHGSGQPAGIFTSAYSGQIQSVSMGTNGAAPVNYDQVSQAVEKVRVANDNPNAICTNPQVYGTYSRLKNTLNDAMHPGQDVLDYWPPRYSTAFSATETQGTSNVASSALVLNVNRVILGLRVGLGFQMLTERYSDFNQYGFQSYLRHDWLFPYASATARVQGILTT